MAAKTISLYTGLVRNEITVKSESTLANVRQKITPSIIEEDSTSGKIWRFVMKVIDININKSATIPYEDAVVPRSIEYKMNALEYLEGMNTLYMADINQNKPDFVGLRTVKYTQNSFECKIRKNDDMRDKFHPIMLERVMLER